MKSITKLLAATALALSMGATAAQAAVFIGISTDGGSTITQVFSGPDGTYDWSGSNIGGFESISVDGDPSIAPTLFHSDVVNVNTSGAASVSIFVTRTDLAGPLPKSWRSSFSSNNSSTAFTVTESTYADASNGTGMGGLWGGTLLSSTTFTGLGSQAVNVTTGAGPDGAGPFSVVHRYDISTTRGGTTSPSIILAGVPEPATWALMIVGFGGAGAMIRSRRKVLVAA